MKLRGSYPCRAPRPGSAGTPGLRHDSGNVAQCAGTVRVVTFHPQLVRCDRCARICEAEPA